MKSVTKQTKKISPRDGDVLLVRQEEQEVKVLRPRVF